MNQIDLASRLNADRVADALAAGAASVRSARRVRAVTVRCETRIGHVTAEVVIDPVHGVGASVLSVVTDDGDAWSLPECGIQREATADVAQFVARLRAGISLGADAAEWEPRITTACDGTNNDSLDADFMDTDDKEHDR